MPKTGGAYLEIYEKLRKQITEGVYPYGSRMPSKRVTAEENGVSVVTAEHAYAILVDEGYLSARERSGFFVAYRESDLQPIPEARYTQLPQGNVTLEDETLPFPLYARTLRRILADYGEQLLVRSPGIGLKALRDAIAEHLARARDIHVLPGQIIIGSGAEYLYSLVVQLLGRESVYAVEDPSYEVIRRTYIMQGVSVDTLPMGKDGILSSSLEQTPATVLHVTPFRSFPSGITASASKRREYIRWAHARGGYLIEDDYDSAFSPSSKAEDTLYALDPDSAVLYVSTFSRTVAPSIRAGYMVLPRALMAVYEQTLGFTSCSVPVLEQVLLTELLRSGDFDRHINHVRRRRRQAQEK
ncbi:MAG: PLP-dependent aminotransferase family protein [Clostridia bacterium]|nr:PLP-dependent aminotransferase family protein [Clostridia bacterium]